MPTPEFHTAVTADPALFNRVRRRAFLRLIPWLFVLYIVAFLDRVNVAFATLEMSAELGFSPNVYGFAGPYIIGWTRQNSDSFTLGVLCVAGSVVLAAGLVMAAAMITPGNLRVSPSAVIPEGVSS